MRKRSHSKKLKVMILAILMLTIGFSAYLGIRSYAADEIYIEIDGVRVDPQVSYEMTNRILQLNMKTTGVAYDDTNLYEVDWSIENQDPTNPVASVTSGSSQTIGLVTALSPGDVTVTVTVKDKLNGYATLATTTCKIKVVFSIDTTGDDSIYKYIYDEDTVRSLVLYADDSDVNLTLNFGDATNTQWTSNNTEIATVGQRTGVLSPVGAGHTTITATYTQTGSTSTQTAVLNVYVIPRVADKATDYVNGNFHKSITAGHDRGDYLYLDSFFGQNNTEPLGDKVCWVIKKDDGSNRRVIADSLPNGMRSDLISLDPLNSQSSTLAIEAKAGVYYVEFYAAGTYESESKKTSAYSPTVVKLTVYADFDHYEETLQVGDAYDISAAFNLTMADFVSYFSTPILTYGGGDASNYATYNSTTTSVEAKNTGSIDVKVAGKASMISTIKSLTNPSSPVYGDSTFRLKLNIIDSFQIDRSSAIIYQGQTLQLNTVYTGSTNGTITWTSSDEKYVTVDETGKIYGVKATTGQPDIEIMASLTDDRGVLIKRASCYVKVEPTVSDFSVVPNALNMKIGENATVKAEIKQAVSVAPLVWTVENSSIATVEPAADNKSAIITAKKGGETKIAVMNTANNQTKWITVTVLIPIESMEFSEPITSSKLYLENKTLRVNFAPTTANSTEMVWTSSDSSIATIEDKNGGAGYRDALVTMKSPGTVTLTCAPKYNPYTVMAMCTFTVEASATSLTIEPTEMTLNAAYGNHAAETKQIDYVLTPEGCTTTMTWTSADSSIATVDNLGRVTARKPGTTYITVQTAENILKQCKVTVLQPCSAVAFSPATVTLRSGDVYTPGLKTTPADTTDIFTWKSFNGKVATVDKDGKITAVKSGSTFVQVQTSSGTMALLEVIVQDPLKGLSLVEEEKTIYKGEQFTISPIFTPAEAYNKNVKWTSSNTSVATVKTAEGTPNVVVTGVAGGTATIRGVAEDGGYTVICIVTVIEKATTVTVSPATKNLQVGKSFRISAVVSSPTATNKNVTWSSSNKKKATVSQTGLVKGKKLGTVYITAKAKDGSGAYARCKVRVVRKVTSIRLNKYTATLLVGKTLKLKKYIRPKNATIKSVTWSSSNNTVATVDASGRVSGLSEGMVRIRVKANDGSNKSAVCLIKVREPVEATGVSVTNNELIVAKGRKIQCGISISPANSTDSIKYFSDNTYVATVNKYGQITALRTGQATIYGKTSNGKLGYTEVLVVGMNRTSLKMRQYDVETLSVNEIKTGVTWYSSNPLVATVSNGRVVGKMPGKTTIYAIVRGVKVSCRVTIKNV